MKRIRSIGKWCWIILDLMKKKGYFGENETINWELVDDDKGKYKGEKKIRFYWDDVSSLSPDVSPIHSPNNSSNKLEISKVSLIPFKSLA